MFQILHDFVKKECSPGCIDWESDEEHKSVRKKMEEILEWWRETYLKFDSYDLKLNSPERINKYSKEDCLKLDNAYNQDIKMEKELTEKMKEIIEIRGYLWT